MPTYLAHDRLLVSLALLAPGLAACGDSTGTPVGSTTATETSTDTTDSPTTAVPTTGSSSVTGESSTGDPTTEVTTEPTTTTDSSTTDTSTTAPACPGERCGDGGCCASDEACVDGQCVSGCAIPDPFVPVLEWSWETNEVMVLPLVADLHGDTKPEMVVVAARVDNLTREFGELVLLSADTGAELWRITDDPDNSKFGAFAQATPVVGDVSGDQRPDIIYYGRQDPQKLGLVVAVDGAGELLWIGHDADDNPIKVRWDNGAAVLANFDDDEMAELAVGGALFDHDGLLVWNQDGQSGALGTPTDNKVPPKLLYTGGLPVVADLSGDGKPELITGREAWTVEWTPGAPPTVALKLFWKDTSGKGNDGWPAVADIDDNGTPEVVLVAWPDIKVLDGKTGKLWCGVDPTGALCDQDAALRTPPIAIKGGNLGGPATIADIDGDGRLEVGIAGGVAYAVYDFHRAGEKIIKPASDPMPAPGAMYVRWSNKIQDNTSAATGSTVFDFQGDGDAELTYQDECELRVFDGKTGVEIWDTFNSSGTIHEYPLVADLDDDGQAEFLAVANLPPQNVVDNCTLAHPDFTVRQGVFVYGGGEDVWVPTRPLWTQHSYHVTNADTVGNVPLAEEDHWSVPGLNGFRVNVQGACTP